MDCILLFWQLYLYFIESLNFIYSIVFPDFCLVCNNITSSYGICAECWVKITFLHNNACKICYKQLNFNPEGPCLGCMKNKSAITSTKSIMKYDLHTRQIILNFKNYADFYVLDFFIEKIINLIDDLKIDIIIPVPMHWMRKILRGYNQTAILAIEIANRKNLYFADDILIKSRHTKSQGGLDKKQRDKNLISAFQINKNLCNKNILLIDDVITTGSTMNKCAAKLKQAGAANIYSITICKV